MLLNLGTFDAFNPKRGVYLGKMYVLILSIRETSPRSDHRARWWMNDVVVLSAAGKICEVEISSSVLSEAMNGETK